MKIVILSISMLFAISFLCVQNANCDNIELYLYKTDDGSKMLINQLCSGKDWINFAISRDTNRVKQIQATSIWNDWKFAYFVKLAGIITKTNTDELDDNKKLEVIDNFVSFVENQLKSGSIVMIKIPEISSDLILYDINGIFELPVSDSNIKHLGKFGYGISNATGKDILERIEQGNTTIILDPPFRELFVTSMQHYAKKIPKPKSMILFYIIPLFAAIVALIAFNFYTFKKMQGLREEKQRLSRNISNIERQAKSSESDRGNKDQIVQRDKYCLESALIALNDIQNLIIQRSKMMKLSLPTNKIQNLIDAIGKKTEGKWLDPVKKRLNDIILERLGVDNSNINIPIPESIDELRNMKWSEYFSPMVDNLISTAESAKMSDDASKQLIDVFGRDVVAMIVDAVDREKNTKGSLDQSIENDLKELLSITGIKELEVKIGQVYNSETHELVINSDPSLVTDREQKITKILSRGLILPSGKIIKAKVSIQRKT